MKYVLMLLAAILIAFTGVAAAAPPNRTYTVIFDIKLDAEGKFVSADIASIIDPSTGSTKPVDVKPTEAYVTAAREELSKGTYQAGKEHVFMYRYYNPKFPDRVMTSPVG